MLDIEKAFGKAVEKHCGILTKYGYEFKFAKEEEYNFGRSFACEFINNKNDFDISLMLYISTGIGIKGTFLSLFLNRKKDFYTFFLEAYLIEKKLYANMRSEREKTSFDAEEELDEFVKNYFLDLENLIESNTTIKEILLGEKLVIQDIWKGYK